MGNKRFTRGRRRRNAGVLARLNIRLKIAVIRPKEGIITVIIPIPEIIELLIRAVRHTEER